MAYASGRKHIRQEVFQICSAVAQRKTPVDDATVSLMHMLDAAQDNAGAATPVTYGVPYQHQQQQGYATPPQSFLQQMVMAPFSAIKMIFSMIGWSVTFFAGLIASIAVLGYGAKMLYWLVSFFWQ